MKNESTSSIYQVFDKELGKVINGVYAPSGMLRDQKEKAYQIFRQQGLPTTQDEEWKYTNILPFLKEDYKCPDPFKEQTSYNNQQIADLLSKDPFSKEDWWKIVLVNNTYSAQHSKLPSGDAIQIQALGKPSIISSRYLGQKAGAEQSSLCALNIALFRSGIQIEIRKDYISEKPLHIIHLFTEKDAMFMQSRTLMVVHEQAAISLIETALTPEDEGPSLLFVNHVSEIITEKKSILDHYLLQRNASGSRWINHTAVTQQNESKYSNFTISLPGARFIRNNMKVYSDEPETESHLLGFFLTDKDQLVDNHTLVDHKMQHSLSNELYKGVLQGNSKGVFNGRIFVHPDAQGTNAYQKNNNLLLSKDAVIDTKPQLEIYADDVKCSHGSTIGQFDEEALFYLRSRGISLENAKSLLINAFAFDITQKIQIIAIRNKIEEWIKENMNIQQYA